MRKLGSKIMEFVVDVYVFVCVVFATFVFILGVVIVGYIQLVEKPYVDTLFRCGDPCIIKENMGGSADAFLFAAREILAGARSQVVVDGYCASACAYFADKARPRVCVTKNAVFAFHQGTLELRDITEQNDPRLIVVHSPDIEQWVKKRGGYPADGFLEMTFRDAKRLWPPC